MRPGSKQGGFTLLELLVALALFALLAGIAYAGLDAILRQRAVLESDLARQQALQQTYQMLRLDLGGAVARPVRDDYGDAQPALRLRGGVETMTWTRAGYPNPADVRRSHLLRVGYALRDHTLVRLQWPVLDRAPGDAPQVTVLMHDVRAVRFAVLDAAGRERQAWPAADVRGTGAQLPAAVRVTVTPAHAQGPVSWLFALP